MAFGEDFTANTIGDYGNVTVMGVTGNYDANNNDGSVNSDPRAAISKEFFRLHKDQYDFFVVFSNFDFKMPPGEANAFYLHVKNDTKGIGQQIYDNASLFGSKDKLQGFIDMGNISKFVADPMDPQYEVTLRLLGHEVMHRWGAYVRFKDSSGNTSTALLSDDKNHWSFLFDTQASLLYGNQWKNNGDGTFTSSEIEKNASPLDLYLMGMYEKSQVPPMLLINNTGIDPARNPETGASISGTAQYIAIDDIIAAEGERVPGSALSQKTFKTAFIFITSPGTFTGEELPSIENIRSGWMTRFSILTDGKGVMQVAPAPIENVPSNPGILPPFSSPRTVPPTINDGMTWLMKVQGLDGSWADASQTAERDTAEALIALREFDTAKQNYSAGLLWLSSTTPESTDYLSRKLEASAVGNDSSELMQEILSRQDVDGGWGSGRDLISNPMDTAFVLSALAKRGYSGQEVSKAIDYLMSRENADGGWGDDEGSKIETSANVLSAFNNYRGNYQLGDAIAKGTSWLVQRQNADGGFGNSPSTVHGTAIAAITLTELGASSDVISNALGYILHEQAEDGSWSEGAYQTSLAVEAVWKASVESDLSVKPADIAFSPSAITTVPSAVTVNATINNLGMTAVPVATIALFDGEPSTGMKLAEQTLAFPGQSATAVSFSITINDGNQHALYIVIDADNLVKESNETNNVAFNILSPVSTYEFEILSSDIAISPNPADIFQDVTISSKISNKGTMNAYNVQIKYYIDDTAGAFDIATSTVDIPAGATITDEITWRANKGGENLPMTVQVDPLNTFTEGGEDNNQATAYMTVNSSTLPNLTISYEDITVTPNPASEKGNANISVVIKNEGFSAASDVKVDFYEGTPGVDGVLLGAQSISSLAAGESKQVSIDWTNIADSGERIIYVKVDPDNNIAEIREDDNADFIQLKILRLTDLVISENAITFSPPAPKDGDMVSINVMVQNRGEQAGANIGVAAYEGATLIDSKIIPTISGNSQSSLSLTYDTSGKKGAHQITIVVDPNNAIVEQSKDNNKASRTFGVQDSRLWLTEQYISPNGDGVKDSTQFFFTLDLKQTVKVQVVSGKGVVVRTFSSSELTDVVSGNITWDGLDDSGKVVTDGQYQIQVVDKSNKVLGSLLVVVDNNRSPITEAIGTKYIANRNLTCTMHGHREWRWLPDESGVLIIGSTSDPSGTNPYGLYALDPVGADGNLIMDPMKVIDPTLNCRGGTTGYENCYASILDYSPSPDGQRIAVLLNQVHYGVSMKIQLLTMDKDGGNLVRIFSEDANGYGGHIVWSPNGEYILFGLYSNLYPGKMDIIKADGTTRVVEIETGFDYRASFFDYLRWSPDGRNLQYIVGNNQDYSEKILRISDTFGNRRDVFTTNGRITSISWINEKKMLLADFTMTARELWLLDFNTSSSLKLSSNLADISRDSVAPDRASFAFSNYILEDGLWIKGLYVSDLFGNSRLISKDLTNGGLSTFEWSPEGDKISVVRSYNVWGLALNEFSTIDVGDGKETSAGLDLGWYTFGGWLPGSSSMLFGFYSENDPGGSRSGIYVINSLTGDRTQIVSNAFAPEATELNEFLSPLGNYLAYNKYEYSTQCYEGTPGGSYKSLWTASSVLNLTANLTVINNISSLSIKGTAQDLNFDGYKLEYSDTANPEAWNLIEPPSNTPVVDDTFTTWVPPYEGSFYVKLTVWDQAGNVSRSQKRVSWNRSSAITNVYKSSDVFSPNGDGIKDTVELHYTVVSPSHLKFHIYNSNDVLVKTYDKDESVAGASTVVWDGRDTADIVVPEGKYTIKVLDLEFCVEVDTTPPDVGLVLSGIMQDFDADSQSGSGLIYSDLSGHVVEKNLRSWTVEYGEGENPAEWHEFASGGDLLVAHDSQGNPILNPIQNTVIAHYGESEIEFLIGKKLRITAEDLGGNKNTEVTDFLEERLILNRHYWEEDGRNKYESFILALPGALYPNLTYPGVHNLAGIETVRSPLTGVNIQYLKDRKWVDALLVNNPETSLINLEWDNTAYGSVNALRIKAIDILGREYYSNPALIEEFFKIDGCNLMAQNSLFEDLVLLKLQLRGVDYVVFDSTKGDTIPVGLFGIHPVPPHQEGDDVSMVGAGASGKSYISTDKLTCSQPEPLIEDFKLSLAFKEGDCGLEPDKMATLSATLGTVKGVSLRNLSYYVQKDEGLQLLRQFDIQREGWGEAVIDTNSLQEGSYLVKAVLSYMDLSLNAVKEKTAENTVIVDRIPPLAQITYPTKSTTLCPTKLSYGNDSWLAVSVEGEALDNTQMKKYELYYGDGENPGQWLPALMRINGKDFPIIKNTATQGQLGLWNVSELKGKKYSVRLKAVDIMGNASCYTTTFDIDTLVDIANLRIDKDLFSPNNDYILDDVGVKYRIDENAVIDVQIFGLMKKDDGTYVLNSLPVRTISSGLQHIGGEESAFWDGKDDSGESVPDGLYGIAVTATDTCGNHNVKWIKIEVDNTPPVAIISYPSPADALAGIVEVKGTVNDEHFETYILEAGAGNNPDVWASVSSGAAPIQEGAFGVWNTFGLEGIWTLRLTGSDEAGNKTVQTVTLDLNARQNIISGYSASPRVFSPNGDGILDTLTVNYELTSACHIQLEIIDASSAVKAIFTAEAPSAGSYSFAWDGRGDSGVALNDGAYSIRLTATMSSNTSVIESETVTTFIDTTPPGISISLPTENSYLKSDVVIAGTISDENSVDYSISYSGEKGSGLVDSGKQNRIDSTLGILNSLQEGNYILQVKADDQAGNSAGKYIPFNIDRTPPQTTIDTPKSGEYYGAKKNIVNLTGAITEKNLDNYDLRYGLGENPSSWTELLSGTLVPENPQLGVWNVGKNAGVADGRYTVSLIARDKAGSVGEVRVNIVIDNTSPEASITLPPDGGYVRVPIDIRGTAYDCNLDNYIIEVSQGQCNSAFNWVTLRTDSSPVREGVIAPWLALPSDGDYCLRLSATDVLGQKAEAKSNVKVDTHPPASPLLSGAIENKNAVRLTWANKNESDLAGYDLYRNTIKVNAAQLKEPSYVDENLGEGEYTYLLKALDIAGNESPFSNEIKLKVDVTGPNANIGSPNDGGMVSGLVDVMGTAYSRDDFRQYRIYIGQGRTPAQWNAIRTSPVPVANGTLSRWDTSGLKGQYSIKLEAEDLTGNINSDQVCVTIDDTPPAPPVLISATSSGSDISLLWKASTEADLAGYLLFRNDQLANSAGNVVGRLTPYVISGTTYLDKSRPDGKFKYYLIAMDQAGNVSNQSNAIEITIDSHPPHATVVAPGDRVKFDTKTLLKAECPDLDIASVQFQYKKTSASPWSNIGTAVTQTPYAAYIDPTGLGMTYGDYQVRALAVDEAGKTDPSPSYITIIYSDLAAPQAPLGFGAHAEGSEVTLIWAANVESDLNGYNIYRSLGTAKTKINSSLVKTTTYRDNGIPDGQYSYEITASDTFGNESSASNTASAKIYAPALQQPYTPTDQNTVRISGTNAEPNSTIEMYAETTAGPELRGMTTADNAGAFAISAALDPGENRMTAKAKDCSGNVSRTSDVVIVIYDEPPARPTGFSTSVDNYDVTLKWNANTEEDLSGYNVYRQGEKLNRPYKTISGNITASSYYPNDPSNAFDSNPSTYWSSGSYGTFYPQWWEIDLPSKELINQIKIDWYGDSYNLYAGKNYEIQVWSGYAWISQQKVVENSSKDNFFEFQPSYRTDKIRIYITDPIVTGYYKQVGISEISIFKDNLVSSPDFADPHIDDGRYKYEVTAVDYYGFESPRSEAADADVGDVIPPSPPQNLTSFAEGSAAQLRWAANSEPDLAGYNVYRSTPSGWLKRNSSLMAAPAYTDAALANGTYTYKVTASDAVGNESDPSNVAEVSVSTAPPSRPLNLHASSVPEGAALDLTWQYPDGTATGYNVYRSEKSGGPYIRIKGSLITGYSNRDTGLVNGTTYFYVATAVDLVGNESAYSDETSGIPTDVVPPPSPELYYPAVPGRPAIAYTEKTQIDGETEPRSRVELIQNGISAGSIGVGDKIGTETFILVSSSGAALSPKGDLIAYLYKGSVWLKDLSSGGLMEAAQKASTPIVWAPDGSKVTYVFTDEKGYRRIGVYDLKRGTGLPLTNDSSGSEGSPSWSFDGNRVAFMSSRGGSYNLWVDDLRTLSSTQVTQNISIFNPILSPDGTRVTYFQNSTLYLKDIATGETTQIDNQTDSQSANWSPDGRNVVFISTQKGYANLYFFDADRKETTQITNNTKYKFYPVWSPNSKSVVFAEYDYETNSSSLLLVSVQESDETTTLASDLYSVGSLTRTATGAIAYTDGNTLNLVYPSGYFSFKDIQLSLGENTFYTKASDASGNTSTSAQISVIYDYSSMADLEIMADDISIYPPFPKTGEAAAINVGIRNKGFSDAGNVGVDVYFLDSAGSLSLIKTQAIPLITASSEEFIGVDWAGSSKAGVNTIIVQIDADNRIAESNEFNNYAMKEIDVVSDDKVIMNTSLDSDKYHSDQTVNITIAVKNPGAERNVTLKAVIEDSEGSSVVALDNTNAGLPYGASQDFVFTWNTAATFAGDYRVRSVLSDETGIVAENVVPFAILRDLNVESSVASDKPNYGPNENVLISVSINNAGKNYVMPSLTAKVRIFDPVGTEVFAENKTVANLMPGSSAGFTSLWNTGVFAPGNYTASVNLEVGNEITANKNAVFSIDRDLKIAGNVSAMPSVIAAGDSAQAVYTVQNMSNFEVSGLAVKVEIIEPETQATVNIGEEVIALPLAGTHSGQFTFSTIGLRLKSYTIALRYEYGNTDKTAASASFSVKDVVAPIVNITSPVNGEQLGSKIEIKAIVTDDAAGVEKVEYRIDTGTWGRLWIKDQVKDMYSAEWGPSDRDGGGHTVSVRAADKAGNISTPVAVNFTVQMDNIPPVTSIDVGNPNYKGEGDCYIGADTPFTLSGEDNYSGVDYSEYRIDDGSWTIYRAPFTMGSYEEGVHIIAYRSVDKTGNIENAQTLSVHLDKSPPISVISANDTLIEGAENTVSPDTLFTISTSDSSSAVSNIRYRVDQSDWKRYINSFSLSGAGPHTISYKALDNVGNEETEKKMEVRLVVLSITKKTSTGPVILVGAWGATPSRDVAIGTLASIFSASGFTYYIAQCDSDFKESLRSGRFGTYFFVDFNDERLSHELREAISYGDGLVFIKTISDEIPTLQDVFGVKFDGMTSESDLMVNLSTCPICDTAALQTRGKAVKTVINSPLAASFGMITDKGDSYPVIVSNQYGRGKILLFTFDLLNSAKRTELLPLLVKSLGFVTQEQAPARAMGSRLVEIAIENSTEPVDVRIAEFIPENVTAESILPYGSKSGNSIEWNLSLGSGETKKLGYWLSLPDLAGSYPMDTELRYSNHGNYVLYGNYSLTLGVPIDSGGLVAEVLTGLEALHVSGNDAALIEKAIDDVKSLKDYPGITAADAQKNIDYILDTLRELEKVSLDLSAIRLQIDELLKIWQTKWYLAPVALSCSNKYRDV